MRALHVTEFALVASLAIWSGCGNDKAEDKADDRDQAEGVAAAPERLMLLGFDDCAPVSPPATATPEDGAAKPSQGEGPKAETKVGQYAMKSHDGDVALAKQQAIEQAREAGILGALQEAQGGNLGGTLGAEADEHEALVELSLVPDGDFGDLDKDVIRSHIRAELSQVRSCYEKRLLVAPNLAGTVVANFTISAAGEVTDAKADGMDLDVSRCVAGVMKSIEFPAPKGGGVVHVRYPFTFSNADTGQDGDSKTRSAGRRMPTAMRAASPLGARGEAIEACLRTSGLGSGTFTVEVSMDDDGVITEATLDGLDSAEASKCIASQVQSLPFYGLDSRRYRCPVEFQSTGDNE